MYESFKQMKSNGSEYSKVNILIRNSADRLHLLTYSMVQRPF